MATLTATKRVSNSGLLRVVETKVNCNYSAVDGVQIDKILDGIAHVQIEQAEKVNEALDIVGKVTFTGVYSDTEKHLYSNNNMVYFNEKIQIVDADAVVVVPKVKGIKQRKETSVFVDATIILELEIYGVVQDNINYVEPNNEGLNEKVEEINTETLLCFNSSTFDQTETFELEEGANVISCYATISINKVSPNGNYVTIDGEINRDVLYEMSGTIKREQKRSDFTEEISLLNCTVDTPCSIKCFISGEDVDHTQAEGKETFAIKNTVSVALWGYEQEKFSCLHDAFSLKKQLSLSTSSFISYNYLKTTASSDHISVFEDMSNSKRIDEVLAIGSNFVKVENGYYSDGVINLSGIISQTIIGKNYDNDDIFAVNVDVPFQSQVTNIVGGENADFDYMVEARCTTCKNKAGKDIALTFDLNIISNVKTYKNEYLISDIAETQDIEPSEYSMFVYKPEENEMVFDIAKKLNVSPDCILSQNPNIVDGKTIEKVVVYRKMSNIS